MPLIFIIGGVLAGFLSFKVLQFSYLGLVGIGISSISILLGIYFLFAKEQLKETREGK